MLDTPCDGAMARAYDGGGEGREAAKALRRGKRRRVARETRPREEEEKGRRTMTPPSSEASPPPPTPSKEQPATASASGEDEHALREEEEEKEKGKRTKTPPSSEASPPPPTLPKEQPASASGEDQRALLAIKVRRMLAIHDERSARIAEQIQSLSEERVLTVESEFGDSDDDGSTKSLEARKVALLVSQSIVSLSSFAGGKRIRVCSGFVMRWNDSTDTRMILTSATLVRSLNGDNNVIRNLMVKVLVPNGTVTDGHIFLVDFHYNIAVVEIAPDLKLLEVALVKDITDRGDVLALGRSYEGGNLMCSRGQIVNQTSIFGCSELLVSSCRISMAGAGGPLVNYNGRVLGINFYEKNQTSYLSMVIVSRILEQRQSFGKIVRPWLGLQYTPLQMVPLRVLERIYQKCPDVDRGLYISNVAEGSPADVSGLCVGDVLVKCGGKVLSTAPEFGAMLLDTCKEHVETHHGETTGDCAGENITVEVVIKQQRDGSTVSKSIAADVMKEFHYNRWPAAMPSYKVYLKNVTPY